MNQQKDLLLILLCEPDPLVSQAVKMLTDYIQHPEINLVDFATLCILQQEKYGNVTCKFRTL